MTIDHNIHDGNLLATIVLLVLFHPIHAYTHDGFRARDIELELLQRTGLIYEDLITMACIDLNVTQLQTQW